MNEPIDPSLAELARFLTEDFLPDQPDGGLWKGKKSCIIAIHYLKKQTEELEKLRVEVTDLEYELGELRHG